MNPNYIINGTTAERVQGEFIEAGQKVGHWVEYSLAPNVEGFARDQERTERRLNDAVRRYQRESEENVEDFARRVDQSIDHQQLEQMGRDLDNAMWDLDREARRNGYYFRQRRAAPAATQLWSVGMTAEKTNAVNAKLMKVTQDAMALGNDPRYGPFIQQHQTVLMQDLDAAFTKYDSVMQAKYNSDPVFRSKCDAIGMSFDALDRELDSEAGWTFEDNDGSLQRAANQWNTI